jgi:hypothetical protein
MRSQNYELPNGEVVALEVPDEALNAALSRDEQQLVLNAIAAQTFGLVDAYPIGSSLLDASCGLESETTTSGSGFRCCAVFWETAIWVPL